MATFLRFEDIEAWQEARKLTRLVYEHSNKGAFAKDFGLRDQIRRAAVSVMSNIAEGFERDGNAEFAQFLTIAKASAAEVESELYVALDQSYITKDEFAKTRTVSISVKRRIAGLAQYLRRSGIKGAKYKQAVISGSVHSKD